MSYREDQLERFCMSSARRRSAGREEVIVAALATPKEAITWHEFNLDAAVKFLDHG
jgi:hypothetical protein